MSFPNDIPESMDNLVYFTNRKMPDGTKIIAWASKVQCDDCEKDLMGKPVDEKTGKTKIRSTIYECPACGNQEAKKDHEEKLTVDIRYSNQEGTQWKEATSPFKRKTWKGVKAYVFENEFTGEKFGVTKRMKIPEKKKKKK